MRRLSPVAALVLLATFATGCGSTGGDPAVEISARCPARYVGSPTPPSEQKVRDALRGYFTIKFKSQGSAIRLVPPVDWKQDPYQSKSWRTRLHTLGFLNPLLYAYARRHEVEALERARDLMLDWIRANPLPDRPRRGRPPWGNKISGDRAAILGYVTVASRCAGLLDPAQERTLRDSAVTHGRYLADARNYDPGNHGLFMNQGLLELSSYLPHLPHAGDWHRLAVERFKSSLPVDAREGVDLEHSPQYQFLVLGLIERFIALPGGHSPELLDAGRRMRAAAGWFVMPDGSVTRLGDTQTKQAPAWARREASSYRGIAPTTRSGFGIVRAGGSYLSVADGYHSTGHKQADELTFELYDRGRHIVTDTGRLTGTDTAATEAFVRSSQAHSSLLVDDRSFPYADYKPYGSGIAATGGGAGWYAIEATNPLVAHQGVRHGRLFLYRPGSALVIVDRVGSAAAHTYTRFVQFDPAISVRGAGRAFRLTAPGFAGSLYTAPAPGDAGSALVRGRRGALAGFTRSPLLGFTAPSSKLASLVPRAAVVFRGRARSVDYVTTLGLGAAARATLVSRTPDTVTVRVTGKGAGPSTVTVTRRGSRLTVSRGS